MQFRITGIEEINKKLQQLEPKVAKKVVRSSMRKGAKLIQTAAKENAPVDTGSLKKSIKVRAAKGRKSIGIDIKTSETDSAYSGKTFYGAFQEYGTSTQPPKWYMKKAFEDNKETARTTVEQEIIKTIEEQ